MSPPDASAETEPPQRLSLALVTEGGDWSRFAAIAATIEHAGVALANAPEVAVPDGSEASIVLGNDALVRRLNARYRSKDAATNVLAFPFQGPPGGPPAAYAYLGDVVLAAETVLREADEQAIEPAHHLQHLVVHGLSTCLATTMTRAPPPNRWSAWKQRSWQASGLATPTAPRRSETACRWFSSSRVASEP